MILSEVEWGDNLEFGLTPLYNSFMEIYCAVDQVEWITREKIYRNHNPAIEGVT